MAKTLIQPERNLELTVNGRSQTVVAAADTPLLYVLRGIELRPERSAVRMRACAVRSLHGTPGRKADPFLRDAGGECRRSQDYYARKVLPRPTTAARKRAIEASSRAAGVDRRAGAAVRDLPQNGWIMYSAYLLATVQKPTESQIRTALTGLKCRVVWFAVGGNPSELSGAPRKRCRRRDERTRGKKLRGDDGEQEWRRGERPPAVPAGYGRALVVAFFGCAHVASRSGCGESRPRNESLRIIRRTTSTRSIRILRSMGMEPYSSRSVRLTTGRGTPTSWAMMAAEELDVPLKSVDLKFGDTAETPDQGGTGNSTGVSTTYGPLRQAAATARQALLQLASKKFGVPVESLTVKDGVVSATGIAQPATYAELIGNGKFNVSFSATAPVKDPSQFKIIGKTNPPRTEIAELVVGKLEFTQDVRLPGMLHARSIRPPFAGSTLISVDGFEGGDPPGLVKVVSKGNYVAVVAKTEWQAIQASHLLKVTWKKPDTPVFPNGYEAMYEYLAKTPPQDADHRNFGDVDSAIASAAQTLTATYQSALLQLARVNDARMFGCRRQRRWRDHLVRRPEALPRPLSDSKTAWPPQFEGSGDLLSRRGRVRHQ